MFLTAPEIIDSCRATIYLVHKINDPWKVRTELKNLGFKKVVIILASEPLLNKNALKKRRNVTGIIKMWEKEADELLKNINEERHDQDSHSLLLQLVKNFLNKNKHGYHCGAGRKLVGIAADGGIYLCHRFVGLDEYKLGTIYQEKLNNEKYQQSPLDFIKKCNHCLAKYLCAGSCYYENTSQNASIYKPSKDYCKIYKKIMKLIVFISSNILEKEKAYIKKI